MTMIPPSDGAEPRSGELDSVRQLIDTRQVRVALQPIVDIRTRSLFAYEALVRTTSAAYRTPREMFLAAARSGCCGELGRAIRVEALATAPDQALFLNIHPNELQESWLLELDDPIYRHAADVYLEVTESVPLSHFRLCRQVLQEIRDRGIFVVIDDLGAGYSNLRYIADLHPHIVKLDRALVTGLGSNERRQRLVRSIVLLCESLGAEVVAEGIETVDELLAVRDAGVRFAQGFLLGRPQVPAPEVHWPAELDEPTSHEEVISLEPVSGIASVSGVGSLAGSHAADEQVRVRVSHVDALDGSGVTADDERDRRAKGDRRR